MQPTASSSRPAGDTLQEFLGAFPDINGIRAISAARPFQHDESEYARQYSFDSTTESELVRRGQQLVEFLESFGLDASRPVLEIGCGVGRLAPAIAARVRSYAGIDISKTMIEVAKLRPPPARIAATSNATAFPFRLSSPIRSSD